MSLNGFFDTLGTEAQFDAWRANIRQKLTYLKSIIPPDNIEESNSVEKTLQFLNKLTFLDPNYITNSSYDSGNKKHLIKMLRNCNDLYRKFGK